jgi:hypothetical protein
VDLLFAGDATFKQTHVCHDPFVGVVVRIEDHGFQRTGCVPFRGRHALDDRLQHVRHAITGLGRDAQDLIDRGAQQIVYLFGHFIHPGGLEIDLVDHRNDLEISLERQVQVGQCLGLHAL